MRFIVDECTGHAVARWLRTQGHDVFSVYDEARGLDDDENIRKAYNGKIIICWFLTYIVRENTDNGHEKKALP